MIRENHGLDPDHQVSLARELRGDLMRFSRSFAWLGRPSYEQFEVVCDLIHKHFVRTRALRHGVSSGRQLAYLMWRFLRLRTTRAIIEEELAAESEMPKDADAIVEETLDFVRYWVSYNFPQYLRALHRIQTHVFAETGFQAGNFLPLASTIENAFLDPAVYALDEYGIPLELARKLQTELDPRGDLDRALERLRVLRPETLSLRAFEIDLIQRTQEGL